MDAVHPGINCMKYLEFVESCKDKGLKIHTWTVNSESDIEKMRQYSVYAIITNYHDRARKVYYGANLYEFPVEEVQEDEEVLPVEQLQVESLPVLEEVCNIPKKNGILLTLGTTYKYVVSLFY